MSNPMIFNYLTFIIHLNFQIKTTSHYSLTPNL
nr:MAG TPA: hypothetical protein [Caudoviricetes sp.]